MEAKVSPKKTQYQTAAKITVAILEDNEPTLKGMCIELDRPDIQVCYASDDLAPFLEEVSRHQPQVAIADLRIRTANTAVGFEAIRNIHEISPKTHCVIYTAYDNLENFHMGMQLGIKAFVSKNIHEISLEKVIRIVASGGTYYGNFLSQYFETVKEPPLTGENGDTTVSLQQILSQREKEILCLCAAGQSETEIAEKLVIAGNTVKAHLKSIRSKLKVNSTVEAVRVARLRGLCNDEAQVNLQSIRG